MRSPPYLVQMYEAGCKTAEEKENTSEDLFLTIRRIGQRAEKAMYQATGGVNTHKDMIFSMGIICAAYGYCKEKSGRVQKIIVEEIFDTAKKMTGKILAEELKRLEYQGKDAPQTNGERLMRESGERGIRGEVLDGFPVVRKIAYPRLEEAMERKEMDQTICQSQVNLQVLLYIMKDLRDTNVLNCGRKPGVYPEEYQFRRSGRSARPDTTFVADRT